MKPPTIHRAADQDRLSLFEILSFIAIILFALLWLYLLQGCGTIDIMEVTSTMYKCTISWTDQTESVMEDSNAFEIALPQLEELMKKQAQWIAFEINGKAGPVVFLR